MLIVVTFPQEYFLLLRCLEEKKNKSCAPVNALCPPSSLHAQMLMPSIYPPRMNKVLIMRFSCGWWWTSLHTVHLARIQKAPNSHHHHFFLMKSNRHAIYSILHNQTCRFLPDRWSFSQIDNHLGFQGVQVPELFKRHEYIFICSCP
jgi:hypothetical protein